MTSIKRISLALALPLIAASAHAEGPSADIPPAVVKQLAQDLDQLQAKVHSAPNAKGWQPPITPGRS